MKKGLFFLISILYLYSSSIIALTYNSEPKIFIQELVDDAVKSLSDNSLTEEEKNEAIKKIALENVDIKALGSNPWMPNALNTTIIIGAIAKIGMVWEVIIHGINVLSQVLE